MLSSESGTRQCHAALEVSRLSVSPQTYFQRFIHQRGKKKKVLGKSGYKGLVLRKGFYTGLKDAINFIAVL